MFDRSILSLRRRRRYSCSERDQYERRVVELDRQVTHDQLQIQAQNKEKDQQLQQVTIVERAPQRLTCDLRVVLA
jgi:hypothetical protein